MLNHKMILKCATAALLVAVYLKALDAKKHLGLEEPNIKKEEAAE